MVTLDDGRILDGHPHAIRRGRHNVGDGPGLRGNLNLALDLQCVHVENLYRSLDGAPHLPVHVQKLRHGTCDCAHRNRNRAASVPASCKRR